MIVRQCLAAFGPEHRCVLQEEHRGFHSDGHRTIWQNDEPGERDWATPADATRLAEHQRQQEIAQADAALIAKAQKIAAESIAAYALPRRRPERAKGKAARERRQRGIRAALWLLTPEQEQTMEKLRNEPERLPKNDTRWQSHHALYPGAWMMQGWPEAFADDYDPLLAEIHADLQAVGIV